MQSSNCLLFQMRERMGQTERDVVKVSQRCGYFSSRQPTTTVAMKTMMMQKSQESLRARAHVIVMTKITQAMKRVNMKVQWKLTQRNMCLLGMDAPFGSQCRPSELVLGNPRENGTEA